MSETITTDPHDGERIRAAVRRGTDLAFRARVALAKSHFLERSTLVELERRHDESGISPERWIALGESPRNAASPAEFQLFARALSVSPRWLAIGGPWLQEPPAGWATFGSHLDGDVDLEFSQTLDPGDLMPLWERPRVAVAA